MSLTYIGLTHIVSVCIMGVQSECVKKSISYRMDSTCMDPTPNVSVCKVCKNMISLELFDSRPLYLHLLDLVRIVYITFCRSFCVLSYFQVLVEI
jgi:hypothetical protein